MKKDIKKTVKRITKNEKIREKGLQKIWENRIVSCPCMFGSLRVRFFIVGKHMDVSSPHTADRDPSQTEGKTEIVATNQSHVNKLAGQWEPGGKDAILMPTPPPHLESCLREQGREVEESEEGEGGGTGKTNP